jgi:hypothetical protein
VCLGSLVEWNPALFVDAVDDGQRSLHQPATTTPTVAHHLFHQPVLFADEIQDGQHMLLTQRRSNSSVNKFGRHIHDHNTNNNCPTYICSASVLAISDVYHVVRHPKLLAGKFDRQGVSNIPCPSFVSSAKSYG